jgi:hypothetical protein
MKSIIAVLFTLTSFYASAYEIEGVPLLKGTLRTDIWVGSMQTTCRVKISNVKNLMEEDAYGNPAYKATIEISLSGGDLFSGARVRYNKKTEITNLFLDGVRDFEYESPGLSLTIKKDGRLSEVKFDYNGTVRCNF